MKLPDGRYLCPSCKQPHDAAAMTRDLAKCRPCSRAKNRAHHARLRQRRIDNGDPPREILAPPPADFAARSAGLSDAVVCHLYGVSNHILRRWRKELRMLASNRKRPDDFAKLSAGMSSAQVAARWGITLSSASRWRRLAGADMTRRARAGAVPADWPQQAAHMHHSALGKHYRVGRNVIVRWARESGIAPVDGTSTRIAAARSARAKPARPPTRPEQPASHAPAPVYVHTNGCPDCTRDRLCRAHQTAQLNADIDAWMAAGNRPREVPTGASGLQMGWGRPAG